MINTKVITFGNQKGGVGKSTLTSFFANFIHFDTDNLVCVVDADDKQMSLDRTRKKELAKGAKENDLYNLIQINSNDFPNIYDSGLKGKFDYVFVDLPGNLKQPGVLATFVYVDYLFIPTSLSSFDLDSMGIFVELYNEVIEKRKEINETVKVFGILNRFNPRMKEFELFQDMREKLPFKFLDNYIPQSDVMFQRNVSTTETYKHYRKGNVLKDIYNEFYEIIKN